MTHTYSLARERGPYLLYEREDGRFVVVYEQRGGGRIMSCMPRHRPKGGGAWIANRTDAGLDYVTSGRGYALSTCNAFIRSRETPCAECGELIPYGAAIYGYAVAPVCHDCWQEIQDTPHRTDYEREHAN